MLEGKLKNVFTFSRRSLQKIITPKALNNLIGTGLTLGVVNVLQLIFVIVVGRSLSAEQFGLFNFSVTLAMIVGQLAGLGWPQLIVRLISEYSTGKKNGLLAGSLYSATFISIASSSLAALGMVAVSFFFSGEIALAILFSAALTPTFSMRILFRQSLMAMGKQRVGLFLENGLPQALVIIVSLIIVYQRFDIALFWLMIGSTVSSIIGCIWVFRSIDRGETPSYMCSQWMGLALPLVVLSVVRPLLSRVDVLLIAPLAGFEEAGLYAVAQRLALLTAFLPTAISAATLATIGRAYHSGETSVLRRTVHYAILLSGLSGVVVTFVYFLFSDKIVLLLFGNEYAGSAPLLVWVSASQVLFSSCTVLNNVMVQSGRQIELVRLFVAALLINLVFGLVSIPYYGALAAAISLFISACVFAAIQIWYYRKIM